MALKSSKSDSSGMLVTCVQHSVMSTLDLWSMWIAETVQQLPRHISNRSFDVIPFRGKSKRPWARSETGYPECEIPVKSCSGFILTVMVMGRLYTWDGLS